MKPTWILLGLLICAHRATAAEVCAPYVEENARWESATLRPHRNAFLSCPLTEVRYQQVLTEWLEHRSDTGAALKSISLGRAINYPWISSHLAIAALDNPRWDARRGRSRGGSINSLAADLLSEPEFLQRLQAPFTGSPYMVRAVSVEKVLVGKVSDILPGIAQGKRRVPYDVQLWLRLERNP